jgi:hypothetical protein
VQHDAPGEIAEAGYNDDEDARRKRPRSLGGEGDEETATATTETRNDDCGDSDVVEEEEQEDDSALQARFVGLSIAALRQLARTASVNLSDCIERKEMIDRLVSDNTGSTSVSDSEGVQVQVEATLDATGTADSTSNVTSAATGTATAMAVQHATPVEAGRNDDEEARRKRPRFLGEVQATAAAGTETRNGDYNDDGDEEEEQEDSALQARFEGLSIASLRQLARAASVDLSDCIERKEMIDRLASSSNHDSNYGSAASSSHGAAASDNGTSSRTRDTARTRSTSFDEEWKDCDLFAFSALVNVDLSLCTNRDEMIQVLHDESRVRPHVARYLHALVPLARLTVPQLRAVAREWRVDVSDCLEKGDIFHRLVCAGGPTDV